MFQSMKKVLKNSSLKGFISLSILLCSFSAYSHKEVCYNEDNLETFLLSALVTGSTNIKKVCFYKKEGMLWGVNYYIHFHDRANPSSSVTLELSEREYNEIKNNYKNFDFGKLK